LTRFGAIPGGGARGPWAPPPARALADGPPWILGWRGAPLDEPENTLVSFRRALALGLDGLAFELRECAHGELVVFADGALERTTNGAGLVAETSLVDLARLDAGGWQAAERAGERIPLPHEVLALRHPAGVAAEAAPMFVLLVEDERVAERAVELARRDAARASVRIASRSISVCRAARDAGAAVLWILDAPDERLSQVVHDERFEAVGAHPAAWRAAPRIDWRAERWWIGCDAPEDLLDAVHGGAFGILTSEGPRAAFARAWARLAPRESGWPVVVDPLSMPLVLPRLGPAWSAEHVVQVRVRNPLDRPLEARAFVQVRRGAFELEPDGWSSSLGPGEALASSWKLRGGSWRIGGDPLLALLLVARDAQGEELRLVCDTPLERVRSVHLDATPLRVELVREGPRERPASMVLRLFQGHVHARIEDAGGAPDPLAILRLGERVVQGGRAVRLPLPPDALLRPPAFSCGYASHRRGERLVRRFCGGLLAEPDSGAPGRLFVAARG